MASIAEIVEIHTPPGTIGHLKESGATNKIPFFDADLPAKGLNLGVSVTFDTIQSHPGGAPFATNLQKV